MLLLLIILNHIHDGIRKLVSFLTIVAGFKFYSQVQKLGVRSHVVRGGALMDPQYMNITYTFHL